MEGPGDAERPPLIGSPEAEAAEREREHANANAILLAIETIQQQRKPIGNIDCPLCKAVCGLRFRHEVHRRGRGRPRVHLEAKCSTPGCLEFLT